MPAMYEGLDPQKYPLLAKHIELLKNNPIGIDGVWGLSILKWFRMSLDEKEEYLRSLEQEKPSDYFAGGFSRGERLLYSQERATS